MLHIYPLGCSFLNPVTANTVDDFITDQIFLNVLHRSAVLSDGFCRWNPRYWKKAAEHPPQSRRKKSLILAESGYSLLADPTADTHCDQNAKLVCLACHDSGKSHIFMWLWAAKPSDNDTAEKTWQVYILIITNSTSKKLFIVEKTTNFKCLLIWQRELVLSALFILNHQAHAHQQLKGFRLYISWSYDVIGHAW